jgi:LytS/YehU family sensor histidine kinase
MIVGTELKQVERITGRLTNGRVATAGALSGLWLGLFVGLIFSLFDKSNSTVLPMVLSTALLGAAFGSIWALVGFLAARGQRDFSSVTAVVATRYEVLVEHKLLAAAQELLRRLPGALPNPFA